MWAYGATVFEIVAGHEPFLGEDLLEIAVSVRDRGRNVLETITPQEELLFPSYVIDVMKKCFAPEPADRPSFAQLVEELERHRPDGYVSDDEENRSNKANRSNRSRSKGGKDKDVPGRNYATIEGGGSAGKVPGKGNYKEFTDPTPKTRAKAGSLLGGIVGAATDIGSIEGGLAPTSPKDTKSPRTPKGAKSPRVDGDDKRTPRSARDEEGTSSKVSTNTSNRPEKDKSKRKNVKESSSSSSEAEDVVVDVPVVNSTYGSVPIDGEPSKPEKRSKKSKRANEDDEAVTQASGTYGSLPQAPESSTQTVEDPSSAMAQGTYGALPGAPEEPEQSREKRSKRSKEPKESKEPESTTYGALPPQ